MARNKTGFLLIFLFLVSGAAALDFQVQVAPTPEMSVYQPETASLNYFNASVSIENPGSVGCEVRIKGDMQQGDQEITRYSDVYRMWPGEITDAEFFYLPVNYTGQVDANLSAMYCEQEQEIGSYSFNMTERIIPNETVESKTLEVNSSSALAKFEVEEALLIPQEYPAYWKVGSERINNSKALLEYEPTLFKKGETITYTVVQNRTVTGKTEVVLEDQEKWYEEMIRKMGSLLTGR